MVTLTIVAAELLSVLYGKWLATGWLHELIDGAVILGLTLPALGYFFARPLTAALRKKARAEAALQDLCRDLDEKVRERTARLEGLNQSPQVSQEEPKGSRQALRTHLALRLAAQEEDRRGVARELHDGIGQSLTAAKMRVEQAAGGQPWQGRESRPELLLSAVPLLQQSLEDLKTALFRIAQEALNNLAKHACARQAAVSLQSDKGSLCLVIRDDGVGFDARRRREEPSRGLGLTSMRERAEHPGGTLVLTSTPGKGTAVTARWPRAGRDPLRA